MQHEGVKELKATIGKWDTGLRADENRGWFERNTDGAGGELLFERDNMNRLRLIDYDGVFSLPADVIKALRTFGCVVPHDFE